MIKLDNKIIFLSVVFLAFLIPLILYGHFAGLLLLFAFLVFGSFSLFWNDPKVKISSLILLLILSIANILVNGVHFGIDFSGGTRIPVILEKPVDQQTMNEMVQIIKERASTFGLSEVKVVPVGSMEIDVELPGTNEEMVKQTEEIIAHQGVFEAIVDGKIALKGNNIIPGTVREIPTAYLRGADWGVGFSVNQEGADHFAKTVKGKADYPLYMFLDRPSNADIFLNRSDLGDNLIGEKEIVDSLKDALRLEGDDIHLYILGETNLSQLNGTGRKAIVSKSLDNKTKNELVLVGYNLTEVENVSPRIKVSGTDVIIDEWKAVGLLSSPRLSKSVTTGLPSYSYTISGSASGTGNEKIKNAQEQARKIISILKGGSLPVQVSLGSKISIPAPMGEEFLKLSLLAILASIIAISIFISIRYKKLKFILPVLGISLSELIILVSLLGSFTIDLSAIAGIIAAIGVGVDAQIVITDELLKKDDLNLDEKLKRAFDIIKVNAIVAIASMIPLMFSGLVEVVGFALSTIIGAMLGYLISRPSYGVIVEHIIEED